MSEAFTVRDVGCDLIGDHCQKNTGLITASKKVNLLCGCGGAIGANRVHEGHTDLKMVIMLP
jgi:hypothetical protein